MVLIKGNCTCQMNKIMISEKYKYFVRTKELFFFVTQRLFLTKDLRGCINKVIYKGVYMLTFHNNTILFLVTLMWWQHYWVFL